MSIVETVGGNGRAERFAFPYPDQISKSAEQFAHTLLAGAAQRDNDRVAVRDEVHRFGASGLLAITVPAEFGGPELGYPALAQVLKIVAAADPSVAQSVQSHFGTVESLRSFGTDEQRRFYFDRILRGEVFGNAQAESGQRDHGLPSTTVTAVGNRYRLDGRKHYTTGSYNGDWIRVSAADEAGEFVFVIIDRDSPGVRFTHDWNVFGQQGTASMTVEFDDVEVDPAFLLRRRPDKPRFTPLAATFLLSHAAIDVGIGAGALEQGKQRVRARTRVSPESAKRGVTSTSAEFHVVQTFGRLQTRQRAAELLLRESAELLQVAAESLDPEDVADAAASVHQVKAFGGEVALEIASQILEFAGSSAAGRDLALDRYWRNVRVHTQHDPSWWKYFHVGDFQLNGTHPPVFDNQ